MDSQNPNPTSADYRLFDLRQATQTKFHNLSNGDYKNYAYITELWGLDK